MGHGWIVERELWRAPTLNEYVDWPGCGQVLRVRHTVIVKRTRAATVEDTYSITSVPQGQPGDVAPVHPWQWGIETSLHGAQDGTLRKMPAK